MVVDTGLMDVHKLVACVMKRKVKGKKMGKVPYRCFKNLDEDKLINAVESAPLHVASTSSTT